MTAKNYKDEKSLGSIDGVFKLSNEVLRSDKVVIDKITLERLGGAAGMLGAGVGLIGVAGVIGGAVLFPFAAAPMILQSIGYLIFKNKKEKELRSKKISRYNEAIKKQNEIIKKYRELDKQRVETEGKQKTINDELRAKINELLIINEALLKIIQELGSDIQAA